MPFPVADKPEPLAREQLRHFVYEFDIRADTIPKRIQRDLVLTFLKEELSKGRPTPGPSQRMIELADFYGLRELVPELIRFLNRAESDEREFMTSVALTRGVGILGDASQRAFAAQYYGYLLNSPFAENRITDLLDVLTVLVPEESVDATGQRMEQIIDSLNARSQRDPMAGLQARDLEDLRNVTLPRVVAAADRKAAILGIADIDARLDQLVAIYLGLDMRYFEYLERWSARMLLESARSGQEASMIAAFRRALDEIARRSEPDDVTQPVRAKALHAIEFLGGTLSEEERSDMAQSELKKLDLLSNEG